MQGRWIGGVLVCCLTGLGGLAPAWADEVRLLNGDRLTGEIIKMEEGRLTVKTPHSGNVTIDWKQVQSLSSEKPFKVQVDGKTEAETLVDLFFGKALIVEATELGTPGTIALSEVKAINLEPVRYRGTVNIGGNSTQGNTDTRAVNASTRWTIRSERHRFLLEGKYNYGEVGSRVTVRNSLATLKYDLFLSKNVFANAEGLFEKDTFQNLTLRTTLGAGLGYQFLESARATVAGVAGLAYVSEDYTNAPQTRTPSARWSLRTEFTLVPDRVKVFHKHEGFYDFAERNAIRFFADQGIRVTVYENLFVNFEYDLRYNGAPAPGRKRTDEAFIFGLGYEFGS